MNTQEILSIVALSLLGLCLLCGLAKMAMRGDSAKKNCDKACSMAVFAAVVLLAISQLIGETDGCEGPSPGPTPDPSVTYCTNNTNIRPDWCSVLDDEAGSSCADWCGGTIEPGANQKTCDGDPNGKSCTNDADCSESKKCEPTYKTDVDKVAACNKNLPWNSNQKKYDPNCEDCTSCPCSPEVGGCSSEYSKIKQYFNPFHLRKCQTSPDDKTGKKTFKCEPVPR